MIANFGFGVLVVSFLVALYSVFAAIYGERIKNAAMATRSLKDFLRAISANHRIPLTPVRAR